MFNLPNRTFNSSFDNPTSSGWFEPNFALLKTSSGQKRLYTSYDTKVFIHDVTSTANYLSTFTPSKGLEALWADDYHQIVYIPDENGRTGIYAYKPDGSPYLKNNSNLFGSSAIFDSDEEGILIYACTTDGQTDNGKGLIIVSDQITSSSTGNDYEVFDRRSWEHLGKFKLSAPSGSFVYMTDGIASTQQASATYPQGVFSVLNHDTSVVGVGWHKILSAMNISCGAAMPITVNPSPSPRILPTPTIATNPTPTPIPNPDNSLILLPTNDATVKSQNPTTNYGKDTELITSNYSAAQPQVSYLMFDLSALSGKSATSVSLEILPTLDRQVDKVVTVAKHNNWDESTLTWDNQPGSATPIGIIDPAVTANTRFIVPLDTQAFNDRAGQVISLAIINSAGSNTLAYSSKEGSAPPRLVISTSGAPAIPLDWDRDNDVDFLDYRLLVGNFGRTNCLNSLCPTTIFHYNALLKNYGLSFASITPGTNPSPALTRTPTTAPTQTLSPSPTPVITRPSPTPISSGTAYRAFKTSSYWNTPMPYDAPIDSNNARYIADAKNSAVSTSFLRITGAPDYTSNFAYPVYWAQPGDPTYTIKPSYGPDLINIRIPAGAEAMGGSDGGIIVYDLTADHVIELYKGIYNSSTDTWSATSTKRYILSSNGLEYRVTGSDNPLNDGHRGVPPPMRATRRDEVKSGVVAHRLECFWHATAEKVYWPMSAYETGKGGITPEGIVLRIKPSVNIASKNLSPYAKIMAKAMQDYGCVIGDNEGGSKNSIKLEHSPADWRALDPQLSENSLDVFTWDNYEFIQGGYDPVTRSIKN